MPTFRYNPSSSAQTEFWVGISGARHAGLIAHVTNAYQKQFEHLNYTAPAKWIQ